MQQRKRRRHSGIHRSRLVQRLVYLPGAIVLIYGGWLTLTL